MTLEASIIGWAWRTPLGPGDAIGRLLAGERAARANPRFDARSYPCGLAAAIVDEPAPTRHRRFVKRIGLHGMEVGVSALQAAGRAGSERLGLYFGVGGLRAHWEDLMIPLEHQLPDGSAEQAWERGFKHFHPFWMLHHLSNNAHALLSVDLGARGEGLTFGGANAGAQALASAIEALAAGVVDTALVVAFDTLLEPETILSMSVAGALACGSNPPAAPYDVRAAGMVPGEAAAALVLERPGGGGVTLRAAEGARAVARVACDGDCIVDGAAQAQPALDLAERRTLAALVGENAQLTAIQAATGHLGGATSLVQAIALAQLLARGSLPPIAGLVEPASGPLRPVRHVTATRARAAIGVSAGTPGLAGAIRVELPA